MNRTSSRKIIYISLIVVGIISVIPVMFLIFNSSESLSQIVVLYDENTDTTLKSKELFSELMVDSEVNIEEIPLSKIEDLTNQIQNIKSPSDGITIIGHGSSDGFYIGSAIINTRLPSFGLAFRCFFMYLLYILFLIPGWLRMKYRFVISLRMRPAPGLIRL